MNNCASSWLCVTQIMNTLSLNSQAFIQKPPGVWQQIVKNYFLVFSNVRIKAFIYRSAVRLTHFLAKFQPVGYIWIQRHKCTFRFTDSTWYKCKLQNNGDWTTTKNYYNRNNYKRVKCHSLTYATIFWRASCHIFRSRMSQG